MKKYNIISSIALIIFSIALYLYASTFPVREGRIAVLNPGFYPKLLAAVLGGLALILLISSLIQHAKTTKKFWDGTSKNSLILLGITLGMLILYPIFLQYVGFTITTFMFILGLIFCLSDREKYGIPVIFVVSFATTTVIYLVFKLFLKIPFPRGIFFGG